MSAERPDLDPAGGPTENSGGESAAFPQVVYDELRRIAAAYLAKHGPGHTLQPTALVHEAFLRLGGADGETWNDQQHYLAVAARAMRLILVDYSRRKLAQKRGGARERVRLDEVAEVKIFRGVDVLVLEELIEELEKLDPRKARIVDFRVFLGYSVAETADALGVSIGTVEKEWSAARAWLRVKMSERG